MLRGSVIVRFEGTTSQEEVLTHHQQQELGREEHLDADEKLDYLPAASRASSNGGAGSLDKDAES